jgi:hypothetical protein
LGTVPHEFAIGGVYFPPILVASILGVMAAIATAVLLNRYQVSRHFYAGPLVFLSLAVIYAVLISTFLIPG